MEKDRRNEDQRGKKSREGMEKTRGVRKKKAREQGKSDAREKMFQLLRVETCCKKLQDKGKGGDCNTTIFKQI